eukprot:3425806-Amphidinium_carterae.2
MSALHHAMRNTTQLTSALGFHRVRAVLRICYTVGGTTVPLAHWVADCTNLPFEPGSFDLVLDKGAGIQTHASQRKQFFKAQSRTQGI